MERQTRTGYGVAALLFLVGCSLLIAGVGRIIETPEEPLRIGTNLWIGYEPLHQARSDGELPGNVVLVESRSSPALMEAMLTNNLDGAALTLDEVMRLQAAGLPMVVTLILDISDGADAIVARSKAAPAVPLPGSRIGVEMDGVGAYFLYRFLEIKGVNADAVTIVPIPATEHVTAFDKNNLDYLVTYEPLVSQLVESGAKKIFDSSSTPREIVDVLAFRRDRIGNHSDTIRAISLGWFKGVAALKSMEAAALSRVARRQGLNTQSIKLLLTNLEFPNLDQNRGLLAGSGSGLSLMPLEKWLSQENSGKDIGTMPAFNPTLLPKR